MGRNWPKKEEITKNQNDSPPRDHNSSPARKQNWMENEFDKLTEAGFRRWVIINFSEPKEHVLTQCKETKNLEKSIPEYDGENESKLENTLQNNIQEKFPKLARQANI
ncbi:LINE-1 retrotransposable element ORF1 protein [Plecturocebus cupreus]